MDEKVREQFKWRFYTLTILLNVVILLVAAAVIMVIKLPGLAGIVGAVVAIAAACALALYFTKQYRSAKEWLSTHQ